MWWDNWELQDGSAPSPSQGTAQHRAFHTRKFCSGYLSLPGESLQLQEAALGCGQDGDPGAHFGREERTALILPSLCRDTFISLAALDLSPGVSPSPPAAVGTVGRARLPQFVAVCKSACPRGQPHLQQQSLGKGSNEPPDQIRFLVLTSRETGESW